ncbi:MAG: response regulator transcription factor [Caulobacteraceae bacterium]|jgi:DNA-binding NarL/FixJ family response regulator
MIRVAIVEDDPEMSARLAGAIARADDMIVTGIAATVAGGSGIVEAGGYDVLLCDLGLPDGSGVQLIRQEAETGRDTDILVITVFADQSKVLDTIRAGARGYLLKDEELDDCIEAIREIRRGGSPISPIIARQLLRQILPTDAAPPKMPISPLSEREHEVLNLLARGFSYSECGEILRVSVNTIGAHVKNIYRKLEVNSRAEALFEANCQGILDRT